MITMCWSSAVAPGVLGVPVGAGGWEAPPAEALAVVDDRAGEAVPPHPASARASRAVAAVTAARLVLAPRLVMHGPYA
jgi:hypothetical protein